MSPFVILALYTVFSTNPDSIIRGVYLNPYKACSKDFLQRIFDYADAGYINTIVVDFKGDYGYMCYESQVPLVRELGAFKRYVDIDYLVEKCKKAGIKLIARVVCFRDNYLAKYEDCALRDTAGEIWYDKTGTAWLNPYNKKVRQYLIDIVEELVKKGVGSFAFDYVRFPTDGNINAIKFPSTKGARHEPIVAFFEELRKRVDTEIGICIFGYAVWYDLVHEGQEVSKFGYVVDVVYPMLYPSHFHPKFKREVCEYWRNYWIYFDSVEESFKKLPLSVKVVPFVQGFDLYAEEYNEDYIFSQILGAMNADADGILIWNAASNYTNSWSSLARARNLIQCRYAQNSLNIRRRELLRQYQEIIPSLSLSLRKNQKKNLTTPNPDSQSDNQPSAKIQKLLIPDQIMPW